MLTPCFVVALKTQAAHAAECFTVKMKQNTASDMVTLLFSVHTIRSKAISRAEPGR